MPEDDHSVQAAQIIGHRVAATDIKRFVTKLEQIKIMHRKQLFHPLP